MVFFFSASFVETNFNSWQHSKDVGDKTEWLGDAGIGLSTVAQRYQMGTGTGTGTGSQSCLVWLSDSDWILLIVSDIYCNVDVVWV